MQCGGKIADDEYAENIEGYAFYVARAQSEKRVLAVALEQIHDRHCRNLVLLPYSIEGRRLHDLEANIQTDRNQQSADQEGYAPAPGKKVGIRQKGENIDGAGAQQQSSRNADLRPASEKAAPARRRMLDGHQARAAPFPADADALENTKQKQHDGGPDPNGG